MLELDVVDAVAAREHLRKVEDVERPGRIVRLRSVFENAVEAQAHDRDAWKFRLIAILAPHARRSCDSGRDDGARKKLSTIHDSRPTGLQWRSACLSRARH